MAQDAPNYSLQLAENGSSMDVRLCLSQPHGAIVFAADSRDAMKFVANVARTSGQSVEKGADGWSAKSWRANECLTYRVDLDAIGASHDTDVGFRLGDDRVAAPQLLMLRPDAQGDALAEATVSLPDGWNVSAPWEQLSRDGKSIHFRIANTPANWSSNVAFGHFKEERMPLPGGMLRVSVLHGADDEQRKKLHDWLSRVTKAILSAYGRLPLPDVQVLVLPMPSRHRAVMFGQSIRGEGNALELLVDPSRPAEEFADDWTAVHELSHLMHPYLGDRGAWLAEGLATYYQNVLRARSGMLTPAQAWDRLYEGFRRGAKAQSDESLDEVAQNMHRSHAFQRVYWAGAAFWLTVDRDLRRDTHGAMNLETALSRFRDCCLPAYRQWQPEDFVARLDALAGSTVFGKRYREFAQMRRFPDWEKLYSDLGIRTGGEHLAFDASASDAAIRETIMAPLEGTGAAHAARH